MNPIARCLTNFFVACIVCRTRSHKRHSLAPCFTRPPGDRSLGDPFSESALQRLATWDDATFSPTRRLRRLRFRHPARGRERWPGSRDSSRPLDGSTKPSGPIFALPASSTRVYPSIDPKVTSTAELAAILQSKGRALRSCLALVGALGSTESGQVT